MRSHISHDDHVTEINIASSTYTPGSHSLIPSESHQNELNLIQSRTSPPHTDHDEDEHLDRRKQLKLRNLRKPSDSHRSQYSSPSKGGVSPTLTASTAGHARARQDSISCSMASYTTHSMWSEAPSVDANIFNSLLVMQDIETYKVVFTTRVCGIELVPFDEMHNLGAVVVKCHTEFSKEHVELQSLLVAIGDTLCIDTDYDEILAIISTAERPLKLTLHPPTMNKAEMIEEVAVGPVQHLEAMHGHGHHVRPSLIMKMNDEFGVEESEYDEHNASVLPPDKLFHGKQLQGGNASHVDEEFVRLVHKHYQQLYHQYSELAQFQELTKDTIADKMDEIKRLSKENSNLKAMLNSKESELHQSQMHQSSEQLRGKHIWDKYQKLNEKNAEMEKKNMELQRHIDLLQRDLKQCHVKIREFTRVQNELQRQNASYQQQQHKKHNHKKGMNGHSSHHHKHVQKHKSSDDRLQSELRNRLSEYGRHDPPPQLSRSPHNITLQTPAAHKNQQPRSRSANDAKSNDKLLKKRESAIGSLFKNFTSIKRKGTNASSSAAAEATSSASRYHPQLAHIINSPQAHQQRKKSRARKASKQALTSNRARSSSLESNTGRSRKETIV